MSLVRCPVEGYLFGDWYKDLVKNLFVVVVAVDNDVALIFSIYIILTSIF